VKMQQAMKNPATVFMSPEMLASASDFSSMQKRAILTQWKDELRQLLIADEESMLRANPQAGRNAECLRRVTDAINRLSM
jgi:hypothetical protein